VDVDGGESGAVEGCGHFHLAIHALLAQDRHSRAGTFADIGCRDVFARVEREMGVEAWIAGVEDAVVFLVRARRVVAQALDVVCHLRPRAMQVDALLGKDRLAVHHDAQFPIAIGMSDDVRLGR
jgi:hypothetical protein